MIQPKLIAFSPSQMSATSMPQSGSHFFGALVKNSLFLAGASKFWWLCTSTATLFRGVGAAGVRGSVSSIAKLSDSPSTEMAPLSNPVSALGRGSELHPVSEGRRELVISNGSVPIPPSTAPENVSLPILNPLQVNNNTEQVIELTVDGIQTTDGTVRKFGRPIVTSGLATLTDFAQFYQELSVDESVGTTLEVNRFGNYSVISKFGYGVDVYNSSHELVKSLDYYNSDSLVSRNNLKYKNNLIMRLTKGNDLYLKVFDFSDPENPVLTQERTIVNGAQIISTHKFNHYLDENEDVLLVGDRAVKLYFLNPETLEDKAPPLALPAALTGITKLNDTYILCSVKGTYLLNVNTLALQNLAVSPSIDGLFLPKITYVKDMPYIVGFLDQTLQVLRINLDTKSLTSQKIVATETPTGRFIYPNENYIYFSAPSIDKMRVTDLTKPDVSDDQRISFAGKQLYSLTKLDDGTYEATGDEGILHLDFHGNSTKASPFKLTINKADLTPGQNIITVEIPVTNGTIPQTPITLHIPIDLNLVPQLNPNNITGLTVTGPATAPTAAIQADAGTTFTITIPLAAIQNYEPTQAHKVSLPGDPDLPETLFNGQTNKLPITINYDVENPDEDFATLTIPLTEAQRSVLTGAPTPIVFAITDDNNAGIPLVISATITNPPITISQVLYYNPATGEYELSYKLNGLTEFQLPGATKGIGVQVQPENLATGIDVLDGGRLVINSDNTILEDRTFTVTYKDKDANQTKTITIRLKPNYGTTDVSTAFATIIQGNQISFGDVLSRQSGTISLSSLVKLEAGLKPYYQVEMSIGSGPWTPVSQSSTDKINFSQTSGLLTYEFDETTVGQSIQYKVRITGGSPIDPTKSELTDPLDLILTQKVKDRAPIFISAPTYNANPGKPIAISININEPDFQELSLRLITEDGQDLPVTLSQVETPGEGRLYTVSTNVTTPFTKSGETYTVTCIASKPGSTASLAIQTIPIQVTARPATFTTYQPDLTLSLGQSVTIPAPIISTLYTDPGQTVLTVQRDDGEALEDGMVINADGSIHLNLDRRVFDGIETAAAKVIQIVQKVTDPNGKLETWRFKLTVLNPISPLAVHLRTILTTEEVPAFISDFVNLAPSYQDEVITRLCATESGTLALAGTNTGASAQFTGPFRVHPIVEVIPGANRDQAFKVTCTYSQDGGTGLVPGVTTDFTVIPTPVDDRSEIVRVLTKQSINAGSTLNIPINELRLTTIDTTAGANEYRVDLSNGCQLVEYEADGTTRRISQETVQTTYYTKEQLNGMAIQVTVGKKGSLEIPISFTDKRGLKTNVVFKPVDIIPLLTFFEKWGKELLGLGLTGLYFLARLMFGCCITPHKIYPSRNLEVKMALVQSKTILKKLGIKGSIPLGSEKDVWNTLNDDLNLAMLSIENALKNNADFTELVSRRLIVALHFLLTERTNYCGSRMSSLFSVFKYVSAHVHQKGSLTNKDDSIQFLRFLQGCFRLLVTEIVLLVGNKEVSVASDDRWEITKSLEKSISRLARYMTSGSRTYATTDENYLVLAYLQGCRELMDSMRDGFQRGELYTLTNILFAPEINLKYFYLNRPHSWESPNGRIYLSTLYMMADLGLQLPHNLPLIYYAQNSLQYMTSTANSFGAALLLTHFLKSTYVKEDADVTVMLNPKIMAKRIRSLETAGIDKPAPIMYIRYLYWCWAKGEDRRRSHLTTSLSSAFTQVKRRSETHGWPGAPSRAVADSDSVVIPIDQERKLGTESQVTFRRRGSITVASQEIPRLIVEALHNFTGQDLGQILQRRREKPVESIGRVNSYYANSKLGRVGSGRRLFQKSNPKSSRKKETFKSGDSVRRDRVESLQESKGSTSLVVTPLSSGTTITSVENPLLVVPKPSDSIPSVPTLSGRLETDG